MTRFFPRRNFFASVLLPLPRFPKMQIIFAWEW